MAWVKWGKYAMLNGNYAISKALIKGEWIYTLWQVELKGTDVKKQLCIGYFKSFKDAEKETKASTN